MTNRRDDSLKQPLLAGEEHHPDSGPTHQSSDCLTAWGGVGGHPSSADHSRHSISQDEEQAEPLLPKSKPNTGPAYDSLTSVNSLSSGASTTHHFASSTMPPGQGIPQPDGSVLPVGSTPAISLPQPPPNKFMDGQDLPPKQGAAVAGPAPRTAGVFSEQYGSYLPICTAVSTGDAQAGPIPQKRGAASGPAPDSSFHTAPIPSKQGVTSGPAPTMGAMPPQPPSLAVSGPAPTYTNPSGPYDPVMSSQPLSSPTSHMPQRLQSVTGYDGNQQRFPPAPFAPRPGSPQPLPMQYPSYQRQQPVPPAFPSSQYRPYQPPPPPQPTVTVVQMPATSYMPYQDQRQPQQGAVVQQPKPRLPVKTSFKFDVSTLDDNHFYIALCLLICVIVCIIPLGLTCTIPALVFAYKAARANEQDSYEEAHKYHKRAQFCNIGTGAAIITAGVYSVAIVIYLFIFFLSFSTSSSV